MGEDYKAWRAISDVPKDVRDNTAYALIEIERGVQPVPMRADEARCALLALAPYSALATSHISAS